MAINQLMMHKDAKANGSLLPSAPEYIDQVVCAAANTPEDYTIPSGAEVLVFSANGNFWCKPNGSGARPTGDVTDGTAWDFNPAGYWVLALSGGAITTLRIETPAAGTTVVIKAYKQGSL